MAIWPFGRKKKSESRPINEKQALAEKNETPPAPVRAKSRPLIPQASDKDLSSQLPSKALKPLTRKQSRTASLKEEKEEQDDGKTRAAADAAQRTASPKTPVKEPRSTPSVASASRKPLNELKNRSGPSTRREAISSKTSLGREADFSALPLVPTLSRKQSSNEGGLLRRKSVKRRAEEKQREEELRNSSPIPVPPKRPTSGQGGMFMRSRRASGVGPRPGSEVSLPLAESLYEHIPDVLESTSYKVSAFDVLAPHPTIRYRSSPQPDVAPYSRRDKEPILPEGDFSERARMNELADGLGAHELKELMDRDRRRRERKKKTEAARLAKRLEKQEQKQKEKSARSKGKAKAGTGVDNAEAADTTRPEAALTSATLTGPMEDNPFASPDDDISLPSDLPVQPAKESPESPMDDPFQETPDEALGRGEAVIETARAVRLSQSSMSPPPSPVLSRVARGTLAGPAEQERQSYTPDIPELPEPQTNPAEVRRASETSSRVGGGAGWSSFFSRGRLRRPRKSSEAGTPSESGFSNASRESFKRVGQGMGPSLDKPQHSFQRSAPPSRTRSKFREDLPDVPKVPIPTSPPRSPPLSRMQSPDLSSPPSPYVDKPSMLSTDAAVNAALEDIHPALRQDIALSRHQSMRSTKDLDSGPSVGLLSQSLASVDSEGSWLSGRPSKRSSSVTNNPARASGASLANEDTQQSESLRSSPIIFGRRISNPGSRPGLQSQASGTISEQLRALRHPSLPTDGSAPADGAIDAPSSPTTGAAPTPTRMSHVDPDQAPGTTAAAAAVLHTATLARSPTLINRTSAYARSREGLLDIFDPVEPSAAVVENADFPSPPPPTQLDTVSPATTGGQGPSEPLSPLSLTSEDQEPRREQQEGGRHRASSSTVDDVETMHAETAEIRRATSVSLRERGHARQMSAGSARLLDLPARQSGENKRSSRDGFGKGIPPLPTQPSLESVESSGAAAAQQQKQQQQRQHSKLAMELENTQGADEPTT